MRIKLTALLTAFLIILVGFIGARFISTRDSIRGLKSEVPETTPSEIPENQSVRLFENEIDYEIDNLLRILGAIADLQVIEIIDASFEWKTPDTSVEIIGKGLIIINSTPEVEESLLSHLEDKGYQQDAYNLEADPSGRKYGYLGDQLACIVRSLINQEAGTESINIEIRCGEIDPSLIPSDTEAEIKTLFVEKYDRDTENIIISIDEETEGYSSGTVGFLEEGETEPSPGNSGMFLAAKNADGAWVLVFDGNGAIPCEDIEPYDFPTTMVPECYDQDSGTVVDLTQ